MASQKEEDSIVGIIPNLEIFPATKRIQKKTKKMNKLQLPQYSSSLSRRISLSYSKFLLFAKKSKVKGAEKSIPFFSLPVIFLFPMMVQFEKKKFITGYIFVASPYFCLKMQHFSFTTSSFPQPEYPNGSQFTTLWLQRARRPKCRKPPHNINRTQLQIIVTSLSSH